MNHHTYIRIGLMGSSCSGKTTTAEILSKELNLKLEKEFESELLSEWISKGIIKSKNDLIPELSRKFQEKALSTREYNSEDVKRGISDRTAADLLVYNRIYVQPYFSPDCAIEFTNRCKVIMDTYTHLFLFPAGVLTLEDNGARTINVDYQKRIHESLINILNEFKLTYTALSPRKLTIEERVQEVRQCLKI